MGSEFNLPQKKEGNEFDGKIHAVACLVPTPVGNIPDISLGGVAYSWNRNLVLEPHIFVYVTPESLALGSEPNVLGGVTGQLLKRMDLSTMVTGEQVLGKNLVETVMRAYSQLHEPDKRQIACYTVVHMPLKQEGILRSQIIFFERQDPVVYPHNVIQPHTPSVYL